MNRNEQYEKKFRAYLFRGDFDRYVNICKTLNVLPNTSQNRGEVEQ